MKRNAFIFLSLLMLFPFGETLHARDLSVQECIEMASDENVTVKNSHLDYLAAKMQKREIFANYFPVIDASAFGFQALNPLVKVGLNDLLGSSDAANNAKYYLNTQASLLGISTTYETLYNSYRAGLTLTQPIFAGGRIVNGNRLASLGIQAATLQEDIARRDIGKDVESKYWMVVSLEEKMNVVDEAIALADNLLKDAQSALDAGLLTDDEMDKVRMKRQELRSNRIRLKGGLMLARMDLCEAIGLSTSEATTLNLLDRIPSLGNPEQYWRDPAEIVSTMEESKLLELAVRQKQLEKNMAMGEALPQIGLGATYGYGRMIGSPQLNGTVFASVKIPITDWSKAANKMKRMEYQKEKAENDREHYESMLELKMRQLWIEVEACWEELNLKGENTDYAEKAVSRAEADYAAGLATLSTLMEKQVALSNARCEEIDAKIAYRNSLSDYMAKLK